MANLKNKKHLARTENAFSSLALCLYIEVRRCRDGDGEEEVERWLTRERGYVCESVSARVSRRGGGSLASRDTEREGGGGVKSPPAATNGTPCPRAPRRAFPAILLMWLLGARVARRGSVARRGGWIGGWDGRVASARALAFECTWGTRENRRDATRKWPINGWLSPAAPGGTGSPGYLLLTSATICHCRKKQTQILGNDLLPPFQNIITFDYESDI